MNAVTADAVETVEVADGVFAYLQPPGGWCVNNAGVLAARPGDGGTVLVDTAATEARVRRLREELDRLGTGPVRTVINTHHHGDHVFGNGTFGPDAAIIAHELARTEMAETGLGLTYLWPDVEWGAIDVSLPTVTFSDTLTLHQGDRRIELLHVGPAHTTNDVVVWLPGERVLFAGDVVMPGHAPFNLMGSVAGALTSLDRLRRLDPLVVVGGHGPVAGPEAFDQTEAYLRWIQEVARNARRSGLSPVEAAAKADPGEFTELADAERIVANLHRAYVEDAGRPLGTPLDVVAIFNEMVEFHGRLPACHA
jgi:cyclase